MRTLSKILFTTALVGTAVTMAIAPVAAQQPAKGSVITVATIGEPPTLDPVGVTADLVSIITQHMFETLYTFDKEWKVIPLVAAAMPTISADGKTYTIPLRSNVKFHDGSAMTPDDVVASLETWTKVSPRGKSVAGIIESIKVDGKNVVIALKEPSAPLISLLAMNNGAAAIMPKAVLAAGSPVKTFVGTGPYKLLEHKPDQYIRVVKFDGYASPEGPANGYGGKREAKIDEIRFVPVPNATTRVEGIIAGQYGFADTLPAEMLPRIKGAAGVAPVVVKPFGFPLMIMNNKTGVLANEKLRQAVLAALGPNEMLLAAFGDPSFFALEGSVYAPGTAFHDAASAQGYNQNNPKKAAELLKAAGYKDEPVRIMTSMQYDFLYKMSLVAQAQLQQAGFKVDLQVLDWATLMQKRGVDTQWDAFYTFHTFVPEPSLITFVNPAYPGWWDTPEKRDAVKAFNTEMDPAKRKGLWANIQKLFYTQVPTIKVGEFYTLAAASAKLKGYVPMPWPFFWNAEMAN